MSLSELVGKARWSAYREGRHCAQRRKAFERDAAKAVKSWEWSAQRMSSGSVVVHLRTSDADKWDGFCYEYVPPVGGYLAACVGRLTLEALQDVARATKKRLDR